MLGIDTNVVIRLVISDDAEQTRRARKLVEQALSDDEPVLVSLLVLLESEWVLRSRYGLRAPRRRREKSPAPTGC